MFYAIAISAVCILIFMCLQRSTWFKDIKLTLAAAAMNRYQKTMNERMQERKQKLLYDGLKRFQDRLRANEEQQNQQDLSDEIRRLNVVEIGAGAGANFEFYPPGVTVTCVEPNAKFEAHIRRNAQRCPDVRLGKFHVAFAEDMTKCIESESADVVVCTCVLCSVRNVEQCLSEVVRILKPGGQFFFLEHIRADENAPDHGMLMQSILKKPWTVLFGCDVARATHEAIRNAAFSHVDMQLFDAVELIKPKPVFPITTCVSAFRPHVLGVATK